MTKDGLYEAYISERQGLSSIWRENGFISYKVVGTELFLSDMFIDKASRNSGECRSLIEELEQIGLSYNCDVITANIFLRDPNAHTTLCASISCGFRVKSAGPDVLLIAKELKENKNG